MKKNISLTLLSMFFLQVICSAQNLQPGLLELTHTKTTSLIFPFAIKSVDRGSKDILAQVPRDVENVLQVKAARERIGETNLTVITADGRLYAFDIRYTEKPHATQIILDPATLPMSIVFPGGVLNKAQLQALSHQLENEARFYFGIKDKAGRAKAALEGIYVYGNTLFFRLVLSNNSPIPYDIDFIRFAVRDRQQAKRTATQEEEILPLQLHGYDDRQLVPGQRKVLVCALEKFNLSRDKELVIEVFEKQGGRHLTLHMKGRDLLDAWPLSPIP